MPRSSQLNLTIHIDDVNDNTPIFTRQSITVDVPQELPMGARVTKIEATDADAAGTDNARVLYRYILVVLRSLKKGFRQSLFVAKISTNNVSCCTAGNTRDIAYFNEHK